MGFWDSAGKLAKEVAKDALDSAREIRAIHDRLESRSSAELRKIISDNGIFSSETETEKLLARKVLRDRGELGLCRRVCTGPVCRSCTGLDPSTISATQSFLL